MLASAHEPLGKLHGGHDARVGPGGADVALHGAPDLGLGGVRSLFQQAHGGDDHAGRAIAALHGVGLDEGFLQRMQAAVLFQAFYSGDLFSGHRDSARNARPHGRSIDEDRARSALALAAAILAAGEFQFVAQDPEEHTVRVDFEAVPLLIYDEFHASILRLLHLPPMHANLFAFIRVYSRPKTTRRP